MTTSCLARSGSDGQMRCASCRLVWDRDEAIVCGREALSLQPEQPEHVAWKSGLPALTR